MSEGALPTEVVACPLCGGRDASRVFEQKDLALGVPGRYAVQRCRGCGLLYQNPRVRVDRLGETYPAEYAAHTREPELSRTLRRFDAEVRWTLARSLGYRHLETGDVTVRDRLSAALRGKRIRKVFPPWVGQGRLLDVGCASGKFLRQMGAVGWSLAGIEYDAEAAERARQTGAEVFVGDPAEAPFPPGRFDLVTAFHSLEHMPDPLAAMTRMVGWLAPGGLAIVEVPNAGSLGAALFGAYWSGFDLPRHLVHFTPDTMRALVERAGGTIERAEHRSKARYFLRSLRHRLAGDAAGPRDARDPHASRGVLEAVLDNRVGGGLLKLGIELLSPMGEWSGRGEAVRYFIRRSGDGRL